MTIAAKCNWPPARRAYAPEGIAEYRNDGFLEDVKLMRLGDV